MGIAFMPKFVHISNRKFNYSSSRFALIRTDKGFALIHLFAQVDESYLPMFMESG